MGIEDRDWYREHVKERRRSTVRRPTSARIPLFTGLAAIPLAASLLQSGGLHGLATGFDGWWNSWRTTPFPPLTASSLEAWVGADQMTNLIAITSNCPAADVFTVVRLHEASTGTLAATGYLRKGDRVEFTLPQGSYILTTATGRHWIDNTILFGSKTSYRRTIQPIVVWHDGEQNLAHNNEIRLCSFPGNLSTTAVAREDF